MNPEDHASWRHGDLKIVARLAKVTVQRLTDFRKGRRRPTVDQAKRLVSASALLGYNTNSWDWMSPETTSNPLFKPKDRTP